MFISWMRFFNEKDYLKKNWTNVFFFIMSTKIIPDLTLATFNGFYSLHNQTLWSKSLIKKNFDQSNFHQVNMLTLSVLS